MNAVVRISEGQFQLTRQVLVIFGEQDPHGLFSISPKDGTGFCVDNIVNPPPVLRCPAHTIDRAATPLLHPCIEGPARRPAADLLHDAAKRNGAARLNRLTRLALLLTPTGSKRVWTGSRKHRSKSHIGQPMGSSQGTARHRRDRNDR